MDAEFGLVGLILFQFGERSAVELRHHKVFQLLCNNVH